MARRSSSRCGISWSKTGRSATRKCFRLNLQYRNRLEFAIGRTCSADWVVRKGERRAVEVSTTGFRWRRRLRLERGPLRGRCFRWTRSPRREPDDLRAGLEPLVEGYRAWIDEQEASAAGLPEHLRETAELVLLEARQAQQRLANGLAHVTGDAEALRVSSS